MLTKILEFLPNQITDVMELMNMTAGRSINSLGRGERRGGRGEGRSDR